MKRWYPALFCAACCLAVPAAPPEVLVNSQGLAQRDVSIRGGSYMGSGLSLNGLNLRVPWSAHFNAELPIPGRLLSEPKVFTGIGNGSGHLVGTTAVRTRPLAVESEAAVRIGTKEHYGASLFGSTENIGGFLDWEKARRIDYAANDLERSSGSAWVQFEQHGWMVDLLTANQYKRFGAQGYYGVPATVYAEEQTDDTLFFMSAVKGDLDGSFLRASAGFRELRDQYVIPSALFSSDVASRHFGLMAEGRTIEVQHIALNLRGDLDHERIGNDLHADRTRGALLIQPEARFDRISLKTGVNSVFQTSESADFLPMAGIDWFATDNSIVYAAWSETEQQPDYLMRLYNDGLYRIGNPALSQQHARNSELGLRQFLSASLDWRIAGFFRTLEGASDWTQAAPGAPWTATDLGTLDIQGLESAVTFQPSEELRLRLFYQWLDKESVPVYAGLYELDYPEHLLNLSAGWRFLEAFRVEFAQSLRWQTRNRARSGGDFGAEASLGLHWQPRSAKNVRLSFLVDNLWGSNFQPIPGLKPRPTTATAGIGIKW